VPHETRDPVVPARTTGLLRAAIGVQAAAVLVQGITAGLLLSAPVGGVLHSAGGYALFAVTLLHLVVALLLWRPGGGPPGPLLRAAGFMGLVLAQVFLGIGGVTALHVPLGVLLFGVSLLQLVGVRAGRHGSVTPGAMSTVTPDSGRVTQVRT
jgi:hypothetical protein